MGVVHSLRLKKAQFLTTEVVGVKAVRSLCCRLWLLMDQQDRHTRSSSTRGKARAARGEGNALKAQPLVAPEVAASGVQAGKETEAQGKALRSPLGGSRGSSEEALAGWSSIRWNTVRDRGFVCVTFF